MTRLYVSLQLLLMDITSTERRNERGQGTLEYVGMVAVAAILVLAVLAATGKADLGKFFTDKVDEVKNFKP